MRHRLDHMLLAVTVACMAATAAPRQARAWGEEGHKVVALIADNYLTPSAKARVDAMLASDTDDLTAHDIASEAVWADKYRDSDRDTTKERYNQTNKWHFVDTELDHPDLDAACYGHPKTAPGAPVSAGPADDCVVDKIDAFARELAAKDTPSDERLLALKFLLHFVGDLHQPLHASGNHDLGGNKVQVTEDGAKPGNLHHFWDTEFVRQLGPDPRQVADKLIADTSPAELRNWSMGTPTDWAREAFGLARDHAYGELGAPNAQGAYALGEMTYGINAEAAVELQLSRAGVRLAVVLNRALGTRKLPMPRAHR
jgi:hypothetical protein